MNLRDKQKAIRWGIVSMASIVGIVLGKTVEYMRGSPDYSPAYDAIMIPFYVLPEFIGDVLTLIGIGDPSFGFMVFYGTLFFLLSIGFCVKERLAYFKKLGSAYLFYVIILLFYLLKFASR